MNLRALLLATFAIAAPSAHAMLPGNNGSLTVNAGTVYSQTETLCGTQTNTAFTYTASGLSDRGTNVTVTQVSGACVTFTVGQLGAFSWNGSVSVESPGRINTEQVTLTGTYAFSPYAGQIYPKYQVLTVDYAPPGAKSAVGYNSGYVHGTSQTNASSFSNQETLTVTLGFTLFDIVGDNVTASGGYTQEQDSSNTQSVNITTTEGYSVPGPSSSSVGVDHNSDILWVWLNPAVDITVTSPDTLDWTAFDINPADPVNEMDYIPLYAGWLETPSTMPADVASRLARTWDTSGVGGLTSADYASILAADPFISNPSFDPNTDTSGRYTLQRDQLINYVPATAGDQPVPQTYMFTTQTSQGNTNSSKDTRTVSASLKVGFSIPFFTKSSVTGKYQYTSSSQWSSTNTDTANQTVNINITPPASTDNYTGPTAIQAWVDNVYGAYMFYPVE
jgi:hypothetical protein